MGVCRSWVPVFQKVEQGSTSRAMYLLQRGGGVERLHRRLGQIEQQRQQGVREVEHVRVGEAPRPAVVSPARADQLADKPAERLRRVELCAEPAIRAGTAGGATGRGGRGLTRECTRSLRHIWS